MASTDLTNRYETIIIMTPVLSDDQHKETVESYRAFITTRGGIINGEEDWRLKKLAFPIKKKTTGYYFLIDFTSTPSVISDLEIQYKRDERILRFLTVKLDKDAIEYIDARRKEGGKIKKIHSKEKRENVLEEVK